MVNISTFGDSAIKFTFTDSDHYLYGNGEITVPVNSLSLVIDESDMACFKKADGDTFIAFNIANSNFASKDALIAFYKENMVGGEGLPTEEIQEMIDESISSATSGYADSVIYNSTSHYVEFYHNGTGGTKVYEFDASDFIVDGMIDDVRIETIGGVSYLVIDFNTASGKQDIQIPLTDIFDPSNYYTKTEVDSALSAKTNQSDFNAYVTSADSRMLEDERVTAAALNALNTSLSGKADTSAVTEAISEAVSGKVDVSTFETYSGNVETELQSKLDSSAYTPFDLPIYKGKGDNSLSLTQQSGTTQYYNNVSGFSTTAIGAGLKVTNTFETGIGVHNMNTNVLYGTPFGSSGATLFSVGNGGGASDRHNAFEIRQNGDIYIANTNDTTSANYYEKPMAKLQDVLDGKQDTLSAGTNITISGNVISAEGGGKAIEEGRGISVTTGETADTVSFNLPISAGTGVNSLKANEASISSGKNSVALGIFTNAYGNASLAAGYNTTANTRSYYGAVFGQENIVNNDWEFACGKGNISLFNTSAGSSGRTIFTVGNGANKSFPHNALDIRANGDIYIADTNDTTSAIYYDKPMIKLQDALSGGSITVSSAITSGDTNAVAGGAVYDKFDEVETVTAAALNDLNDKFGGLKIQKVTQAEYDALVSGGTVDNNTLYVVV